MNDKFFYLGYKRDYGPGYDENGFAQGSRPDAFSAAFIDATQKMYGPEPIKVAYDYSEEFSQMVGLPMSFRVRCDAQPVEWGVEFTFSVLLPETRRFGTTMMLSHLQFKDQAEFDRMRQYAFNHVVRQFVQQIMTTLYPITWKEG